MEHRFDLAIPAGAARAELATEPFLRDFAEGVGVTVTELAVDTSGPQDVATMQWLFSTRDVDIPDVARRFLGDPVTLRWRQAWGPLSDGGARGSMTVELVGRPSATCTGTSILRASGTGSRLSTTARTEAALPRPLAGRVEELIDRQLVGWILSVHARVLQERNAA